MMRPILWSCGLFTLCACTGFGQLQGLAGATFLGNASGKISGTTTFNPPLAPLTVVTGAPYSGERVTRHVQTLSDGTQITQTFGTAKQYRDSQGRTRVEQPIMLAALSAGAPSTVQISDPVTGVVYTLDPLKKVAHRVKAATTVAGPLNPVTTAPPSGTGAPQIQIQSLGTQVINGILAEGRLITRIIAAGAQGNDKPLTIASEIWTSPDLRIGVMSKTIDPRSGETSTQFTNLSQQEPDPSLFQPPPDYSVVDETGQFTINYSWTKPATPAN